MNDKDKQMLDFLLQFNSDQKIAVLGFLIGRLYEDENFIIAIKDAIQSFHNDPDLTNDITFIQ